jgi:hypothetical protein
MDYLFEKNWKETLEVVSKNFGETLDYSAILLLIGLQELGIFDLKFKKDEKLELMHIAVCTLLEPYGYYEFEGRDAGGWPHFRQTKALPELGLREQEEFLKDHVLLYFQQQEQEIG